MKTLTQLSVKASATATRPEIQLLLCCTRTCIHPETASRIKTLLQKDIDWAYLIQTAARHGVMPLLYQTLNTICPKAVPKAILAELRNYFHTNTLFSLFQTKKLLELLNLFEAHKLPAIPFKGPILAGLAYNNLALRQFCDLDILVHERDALKAKDLLISHEYQLVQEFSWEYQFVDKNGRVNVDLHWAVAPHHFCFLLDFNSLWERLEPVSLIDTTVQSFSPEDLLLILCMNVARDCCGEKGRLSQICDIAELLCANREIDWGSLMEQANRLGTKRMLLVGLFLARDLLGTTLPEEVLQKLQAEPALESITAQMYEWLFYEVEYPLLGRERTFFYFKLRERLQDLVPYLIYYASLYLPPNETDRAFLPLPPSLSFLYYLIRPLRVFGKYSLSLLKHYLRKLQIASHFFRPQILNRPSSLS